jgi:hypothetical protein
MVYRLGQTIRFYRLRNRDWQRYLALSSGGVACSAIVLIGMTQITHNSFLEPRGNRRLQTASTSPMPTTHIGQTRKSGSSKPAPTGTSNVSASAPLTPATQPSNADCNLFPPQHDNLATATSPELRKLAQYELACGGGVAQRSSLFVPTPSTISQAQTSAQAVAAELKAYALSGVEPLVFMEPVDLDGSKLDLSLYADGGYDAALIVYFQALQSAGINSATMGMWVYLPEGNLPVWSTTDPAIYAKVVTKMAQLQKQYFPASQVSLMLDSESYGPNVSWGNGSYVSLIPYVQSIPAGLIDRFGLQGFPWAAPANQPTQGSLYNPKIYLRTDLAMQAARSLGTTQIWLNTGTFNQMYVGHAGQTVSSSPTQRAQILESVVEQAQQAQSSGFSVAIHLFAQNKGNTGEGIDWSYWQRNPGDQPSTVAFTTFARQAAVASIPIWLYDSY